MNGMELSAVSEEIAAIKRESFEAGREAARQELNKQIDKANAAEQHVDNLRSEWHQVMHDIQFAYMKKNGKGYDSLYSNNPISKGVSRYGVDRLPLPKDTEQFCNELARVVRMGKDFELMLTGIEENEIIKTQWNRLLVAMRMNQSE